VSRSPDVLLFDLFGTLVFFDDSRIATLEVGQRRIPMTIPHLPGLLGDLLPGVSVLDFLEEMRKVGNDILERKKREGVEVHTSVRFAETLRAFGVSAGLVDAAAARMADAHMDSLARAVVCPPGRRELLAGLGGAHRLALLSNFDDGPTARRVLAEAGLEPYFEVIVISAEEGIRKPSREIFARACARMGVSPSACLYVGDTFVEDIEGAAGAGLSALWVSRDAAVPPAVGTITDVDELPAWLSPGVGRPVFSAPGVASR
jgi:HAD superfamily hydrolase (TIGR01549 family)